MYYRFGLFRTGVSIGATSARFILFFLTFSLLDPTLVSNPTEKKRKGKKLRHWLTHTHTHTHHSTHSAASGSTRLAPYNCFEAKALQWSGIEKKKESPVFSFVFSLSFFLSEQAPLIYQKSNNRRSSERTHLLRV